ncbi:MAG: exosortase/archaeosortase family protein [Paludibacteraceae bacterium]|nr:exosortase/archaeosortase family protein [Paludibacteraceae bacterium]
MTVEKLKNSIAPYSDVILFMITLLLVNWFWKYTVIGDEQGDLVTWFGLDITDPFELLSCHVASMVYWLVSLVRDTVHMVGEHTIRFDSGSALSIIWGCSGLKQSFIWMCLMLTVRGNRSTWLHKLWYIPVGWLCCYVFNILRIFWIALIIEHHPTWFYAMHDCVFKYMFYAMLFGLWVLFVEKIRKE